jgi:high affinity cGMP-specific 3',5'-cyclic phosphodiesterase 9
MRRRVSEVVPIDDLSEFRMRHKVLFKLSLVCLGIAESVIFQVIMILLLIFSIILDQLIDIFQISCTVSDALYIALFASFLGELLISVSAYRSKYVFTMYFIADVLSIAAIISEISIFTSIDDTYLTVDSIERTNYLYIRAARFAVFGARIGREFSIMRYLSWIPGISISNEMTSVSRLIVKRFNYSLGQRTSSFVVCLSLVLPLCWTSPLDQSVVAFRESFYMLSTLAESQRSTYFDTLASDMLSFYDERNYTPVYVSVTIDDVLYKKSFETSNPSKKSSSLLYSSFNANFGNAYYECLIDYTEYIKDRGAVRLGSTVLVVFVMIFSTLFISNLVTLQVFLPLDRLFIQLKSMGEKLFGDGGEGSENSLRIDVDEENIIEHTIKQIALFAETTAQTKAVIETAGLQAEELGVLNLIQDTRESEETSPVTPPAILNRNSSGASFLQDDFNAPVQQDAVVSQLPNIPETSEISPTGTKQVLPSAFISHHSEMYPPSVISFVSCHIDPELIDSWNLNILDLSDSGSLELLAYIFYESKQADAVNWVLSRERFAKFIKTLRHKYLKNPYHTWEHAVDVTHTLYRFMNLTKARHFLKLTDRFSLLFAALAHDAAHPGVNNQFLTETSDPLALKYNDRSPLENMHCSILFEMAASDPDLNIFADLSIEKYRESRKVIIEAILKTDNSQHFQMVKDMQLLYQTNKEVIDQGSYKSRDLFKKNDYRALFCNVLLHQADVSNVSKPWNICQRWTNLVMEEFFQQGDKEKKLGITVQMLNDRDKVNIPQSQVGFIEFIISPLFAASLALWPGLKQCSEQVVENLGSWIRLWRETTNPSQEEIDKMAVRLTNAIARYENRISARTVQDLMNF